MGIFRGEEFLGRDVLVIQRRYLAFFLLKILLHHEHLRTRFAHFLSHGRLLASAQHQRHLEWKLLAFGTNSSYQKAQTFIFPLVSSIYFPHQIRVLSSWIQAKRQVHDEIARFRKRSASDAVESKSVRDSVNDQDAVFRERSVSFTTPPSVPLQPTPGLTSALSGESIRNLVGGLIGSLNTLKQKTVDSSLESVNEDFPAMRNYPNPGSITDLVHMK